MCSSTETGGRIIIFPFGSLPVLFLLLPFRTMFHKFGCVILLELLRLGSDVDGKVNVDTDGDGIGYVCDGFCDRPHTQEEAAVLRDLVDHIKANYPLDHTLDSACRVKSSTSVSRSQPLGNTKKDKIQQTSSSTQKNKHSKLNANSKLKCVKCNGCMLFDNHDLCVLDFINNVNARVKSKSVKKSSKRKVWKPTGKVFTNIGYIWRPTSRTFTIVGNTCPLTRITTTTEVPLRKPTALENESPKPVVFKYVPTNKKEPSQSWGSIVSDVPSSSLDECKSSKSFSVKFGNDHVAKILGYGDYQIGNGTISRVYYVEGLGHNLFSVGQFCDSNLEVAFRQHTCFICNLEDVDLLTRSQGNNLYTLSLGDMMASSSICLLSKASKTKSWPWHIRLSHLNFVLKAKDEAPDFIIKFLKMIQVRLKKVDISHETSVALSPQQNGIIERRNRKLIKAARTMLIYAKALLFLWAEAVATTCYTQNRSIVRLRYGKTPYGILHDKLPYLSFFHVFGTLCYPTNDSENLGPALYEMTLATISSGLVPNPPLSTLFVPPSRSDWDLLFQPLFDELLTPPPSVDYPVPEVIAPIHEVVDPVHVVSTGSPSSTNVDQDAPSPSNSQTTPENQPLLIPNDVEEDNHDIEVAHMGNDPYFGIPILEVHSDQSSSSDIIYTIVHPDHQISEHNSKWTKDHPLENIIGELARPVSTRLQLHEQALFCYYDAFLTAVEPKTYKDALTQSC
ncbi:retrovirus-related pol polyprotein from transposon TNT 1-94 [Tanacetum coccineum]